MSKGLSILVADDHAMTRKGTIAYLKAIKIATKFYEAENGNDVLRLADEHNIDLYLLDIEMPQLGGYEAAKFLLKKYPESKIIVITMFDGHALMNGLLSLGVKGFFLKGDDLDNLELAIRTVLDSGKYVSASLKKFVNKKQVKDPEAMEFTTTELKLVKMLSEGYSSSEIAVELGLSIRSAETYRHRLIKRLNVANSVELIDYFYKNGLMKD